MHRQYYQWHSRHLNRGMEVLVFGHDGPPVVVFPTSMGAFFEYEDRGMVQALAPKLEGGALRLICVSTVDSETFYAKQLPPRVRLDRYLAYERYLIEEVVPFVQYITGHDTAGVTGCSFGAYHALTMALRHPDVFSSCITMGGAFDIQRFTDGYFDDDVYFLSPPQFVPRLDDAWFLDRYRRNKWVFVTGEQDICRADTEHMAGIFAMKSIPHSLHVWGHGSMHDWPEWTKMADAYVP